MSVWDEIGGTIPVHTFGAALTLWIANDIDDTQAGAILEAGGYTLSSQDATDLAAVKTWVLAGGSDSEIVVRYMRIEAAWTLVEAEQLTVAQARALIGL